MSQKITDRPVSNIRVRLAEPRDYDGLCVLFDELDAFHRVEVPWLFVESQGPARSREYFEPFYAGKESAAFVAEAGGHIVGAALGFLRETNPFPIIRRARYAILDALGVTESSRRRGVGADLTRALETWAAAGGAEWVELGVYEFNEGARRFYDALGYPTLSRKLRKPLSG
jgi:GNAT superfamily N-acetyltransferase